MSDTDLLAATELQLECANAAIAAHNADVAAMATLATGMEDLHRTVATNAERLTTLEIGIAALNAGINSLPQLIATRTTSAEKIIQNLGIAI